MEKRRIRNGEAKPVRPYVGDFGAPMQGGGVKAGAGLGMVVLATVAGFCVGFVVWAAFRLSTFLTELVWNGAVAAGSQRLEAAGIACWWLPIAVCTLGGLAIGLWSRFAGGDPDSLETVMGSIKRTGEYRVNGFGRGVVGFLLPLAFGGSIGPEAGLTGLIASAVCWIGRTLRAAGLRVKAIADITVSAALSAIFATPLLGVVAVAQDCMPRREGEQGGECDGEEARVQVNPTAYDFRRWAKVMLYAAAAFGAVCGVSCVASLFGAEAGLPRFEGAEPGMLEMLWFVPCVALGYAGALLYHAGSYAFGRMGAALEGARVFRPVLGGLVLGIVGAAFPYVLFPGETQTFELMGSWQQMGAAALVATGLLKCLATPWCLSMGWRGGHFFPCIFAGIACGYGMSLVSGIDPMFGVAVCTAALMSGVQRKPFVAMALLLLCFPASGIVWMGLACLIGAAVPVPSVLLERPSEAEGDGSCSNCA